MKIAISDSGYYFSLIERLLGEGHEVYIDTPPGMVDNLCVYYGHPGVHYVKGVVDFHTNAVDLLIGRETDQSAITVAKVFGIPVIGHSAAAQELELNREFAFAVVDRFLAPHIKTPEQWAFTTIASLQEFLDNCEFDVVIKQHVSSPQHRILGRTVISRASQSHSQALSLLNDTNPWFEGTVGGAVVERFIAGSEVCFGGMFNGHSFSNSLYYCQEYKDAQNGNRSGQLTGEIGSTLTWVSNPEGVVASAFSNLAAVLKPLDTKGMVDINCILAEDGTLYLVEFTVRWGRPTMELQLASYEGDFGQFLYQIATGGTEYETPLQNVAGVVVFDYGLPQLPQVRGFSTFTLPNPCVHEANALSGRSHVLPILGYLIEDRTYSIFRHDGRHFACIGVASEKATAVKLAYTPLQDFKLPGTTWRDDIGDTWSQLSSKIEGGILYKRNA